MTTETNTHRDLCWLINDAIHDNKPRLATALARAQLQSLKEEKNPELQTYANAHLFSAAIHNLPALAQIALSFGANPNHQDDTFTHPLTLAAYRGHTEVCDALIDGGAIISATHKTNLHEVLSAADAAFHNKHMDTAALLLRNNCVPQKPERALNIVAAYDGPTQSFKSLTGMKEYLTSQIKRVTRPAQQAMPSA